MTWKGTLCHPNCEFVNEQLDYFISDMVIVLGNFDAVALIDTLCKRRGRTWQVRRVFHKV